MSISLAGIFPPIPTPFQADGEIDFAALERNLTRWNAQPLAGYVVGGSNGEFVFMTPDERVQVVHAVQELVPEDRLLIAGAAAESSRETIDITRRMAEAGAELAIVVTPHYFKNQMTAEALEHHYRLVADASPIPIILYSVPANTGIDLPVETVARLAEHPNVLGLKESGGDVTKIARMVRATGASFQILAGSAGFFLGSLGSWRGGGGLGAGQHRRRGASRTRTMLPRGGARSGAIPPAAARRAQPRGHRALRRPWTESRHGFDGL